MGQRGSQPGTTHQGVVALPRLDLDVLSSQLEPVLGSKGLDRRNLGLQAKPRPPLLPRADPTVHHRDGHGPAPRTQMSLRPLVYTTVQRQSSLFVMAAPSWTIGCAPRECLWSPPSTGPQRRDETERAFGFSSGG